MKDGGISEFEGREFAKQTMIDYDENKKMFLNDQAVVDYDNFMKEKSILLDENEDEKPDTLSPYQQARMSRSLRRESSGSIPNIDNLVNPRKSSRSKISCE